MLFNNYKCVYINDKKTEIKTGNFNFTKNEGMYLTDVNIEENENDIKLHGFLRSFSYHSEDDFFPKISKKNWNDYCLEENNFVNYNLGWFLSKIFKSKIDTYLKTGFYMKKTAKEVCIVFNKHKMPTEIYLK